MILLWLFSLGSEANSSCRKVPKEFKTVSISERDVARLSFENTLLN